MTTAMMRFAAAGLVVIGCGSRCVAGTDATIAEKVTGAEKVFPISFWCGPPRDFVTVERYQQIKDAGFTFIMPDCVGGDEPELQQKILDTAQQVGLRALVDDQRMPHDLTSEEAKRTLDAIIADYSHHPALAGYFVNDEPHSRRFAGMGQVFAYLRDKDPAHPAYTNIMPNWARPEHTGLPTYEHYVEQFMRIVKPPLLSYDHYSFFKNSDRAGYFANLELIRAHALKAGVPFWQIIQTTSHGDYRRLTESEKRWEAMHALAYGAKGVLYFTYWEPDSDPIWDEAIIALDGTATRQYEEVKRINHDVQAIGRELLNATSVMVMQQGRPGDLAHTLADLPIDFASLNITVGQFRQGNTQLLMFVNRDYRKAVEAPMVIDSKGQPVEQLDRATGTWKAVQGGAQVRLSLLAGDAALYRWMEK